MYFFELQLMLIFSESIKLKLYFKKLVVKFNYIVIGKNDEFDLTRLSKIEKIKIFNRYGTAVFEQENYTNQWQGQDYNGNILPDSTYYYQIIFHFKEAKVG